MNTHGNVNYHSEPITIKIQKKESQIVLTLQTFNKLIPQFVSEIGHISLANNFNEIAACAQLLLNLLSQSYL